jgi:hypothetical protein
LFGLSKKKTRLAFLFGFIFSDVAKEMKIELTPGMIDHASQLILRELSENSVFKIQANMHSTVLAIMQEVVPNLKEDADDSEEVV